MTKYILIHDLGTSGNKATLFTEDGEIAGSEIYSFSTNYFDDVCAEQDADDWWEAVKVTSRKLLSGIDPKQIAVVSFSGQMQGCLCVDGEGVPLHPSIIWSDQRGVAETDMLVEKLSAAKVYDITGHRASPVYSIEKLMWLKNNRPQVYGDTHKVLNAKDFIIFNLTGNFVTDYSDASGTNAFDISLLDWSDEILDAVGIDHDLMPDVMASTDVAGYVTKEAACACGIPEGTPVICGGGDGACAAVGAGSVQENLVYICMGTSAWIAMTAGRPLQNNSMDLINFLHLEKGKYMPCGSTSSCGNVFNWVIDVMGEESRDDTVFDRVEEQAALSSAGSNGLIFLPYLTGERSPIWNPHARGSFIGLSLSHSRGEIYRAVMEGILFNLEIILQLFKRAVPVEAIRLIGGSENETWNQMMADIFNVTIQKIGNSRHATSIGAAVAAGVGIGLYDDFGTVEKYISITETYKPVEENVRIYNRVKPIFNKAYTSLIEVYSDLIDVHV